MKGLIPKLYIKHVIFLGILLSNSFISISQYDTIHYIPPFYGRTDEPNELGRNHIFLSTNETTPFYVTVTEADGTEIAVVPVSKSVPKKIWLGYQFDCTGIVDSNSLNIPLVDQGIIVTASRPFFANVRHTSGKQGMSLTCKGNSAKGLRFRSGHLYTTRSANIDGGYKSHMISVMATEDNTTVTFSDFKEGVIFHNTTTTGNTSDDITITLDKYESYIIAAHLDEALNMGNDTLINGSLIEANKPIVVNSGSMTGGSDQTNSWASRDIGMDQIVPFSRTGTKYIVTKRYSYLEDECERVIIVADQNNTNLYLNDNPNAVTSLNAGEFYIVPASSFDSNDILYVNSSQPIYVYQSTNGSGSAGYTQGMNFVPPIRCNGINEVTIPEIDSYGDAAGIDIIAKAGSSVMIDGSPLSATPIPVSGNPDWVVYKLSNISGTHNFWSNQNINITMIVESGARGAAGYYSGFSTDYFQPEIRVETTSQDHSISENCSEGKFVICKPNSLLNQTVTYDYSISGTAINGIDYTEVESFITIPAGQLEAEISILALYDGQDEEQETIQISLNNPNTCEPDSTLWATILINENHIANISVTQEDKCSPSQVVFSNTNVNNEQSSYLWDFGDGNVSNDFETIHSYENEGIYSVTLTMINANGCQDTIIINQPDIIQVLDAPHAGFILDKESTDICNSEISIIDDSNNDLEYTYLFHDGNNQSVINQSNPVHTFQNSGNHLITQIVSSTNGCADTAFQEVLIEPFNLFAPNTFTPDGNAFNNVFNIVVDLNIYEWNLNIYNRWGELVFETNDPKYGWDGTSQNGSMSIDGTYTWSLNYVSCSPINTRKSLHGHVNLIR